MVCAIYIYLNMYDFFVIIFIVYRRLPMFVFFSFSIYLSDHDDDETNCILATTMNIIDVSSHTDIHRYCLYYTCYMI